MKIAQKSAVALAAFFAISVLPACAVPADSAPETVPANSAAVPAGLAKNFPAKTRWFGQTSDDLAPVIPYGANDDSARRVLSDDAQIYYEIYGPAVGVPVVVLHGGQVGCTYEMGRFIEILSQTRRVIAISTRGHGRSEIGTKPVTYAQRAADVLAVMDAENVGAANLLGFSDGAYAAYKTASVAPARVRKIAAIGAGENLALLRRVVPLDVEAMKQLDPAFMQIFLSLMPEPERLQEHWSALPAFYNFDMIADKALFNSIRCPTLLVSGELDPNAPLDTVISAYRMIPNCSLAIIAGAPHQAFVTNFEAVWANVGPFLAQ